MRVELPEELALTVDGPVATLTIDRRAKRNAFALRMWQALPTVTRAVREAAEVRVLVIRGAGDGPFSAGADITEFQTVRRGERAAADYSETVHQAELAIASLTKPTVALIQGWCVGGGCELALACDLRIADETARFGITPSKLGVVYNQTSTARVVETVGPAWAKYILFTGELLDADVALRIGLVHEVHPVDKAAEAAYALAGTLSKRAPITIAGAKQLVNRAAAGTAAEDEWAHRWYQASYRSAEYAEGVAAFVDKRQPDFTAQPWPTLSPDEAP
jgi:enoyl-CoA hydratase/carnithine racemase